MLPNGTELGHYRILNLIKRGGMGEVYQAEDTALPRQVAIKVIQSEPALYPNSVASQEAARLFQREMKAIASLDHPHILPLIDFGEQHVDGSDVTYMVMPLRTEGSLSDWLRRRANANPLSVAEVGDLIRQAASALTHAHAHGFIHQDVKPSNFLVRKIEERPEQPDLQLADFGVARLSGTSKSSTSVRGTLEYMAPEQLDGHAIPASDQYALAIMAYELLTGQVPFRGTPTQIIAQHSKTVPPAPSTINPQVPTTLDSVILRALEKDPGKRFPAISAFSDAFNLALQGKQYAPDPDYVPTKLMDKQSGGTSSSHNAVTIQQHTPRTPVNKNVVLLSLVALLALALIGGTAFALAGSRKGPDNNSGSQNNISGPSVQVDISATTQANSNATATANAITQTNASATTQAQANANATANAIPPTPTPTPFPSLASSYLGRAANQNVNMRANIAFTNIVQNQGSFNGYAKFGLPLLGSGPLSGTISSGGSLQFTVNSNDGSNVTLNFTGSRASDGTLNGSYTVSNGQSGQWQAGENSSPTVYPTLFTKYGGVFVNNVGARGALAISLSNMGNDGSFSGTMSAQGTGVGPINGRVGSDNTISFTFAPGNGATITLTGTIAVNDTMSGTYTASNGGSGSWQAAPSA